MTIIQVSDDLAQTIEQEAQTRGLTVEKYLQVVIRRQRTLAARQRIEQEQAWWFQQPLSERAEYEGQFVAIIQQEVVDHDEDENAWYYHWAKFVKSP